MISNQQFDAIFFLSLQCRYRCLADGIRDHWRYSGAWWPIIRFSGVNCGLRLWWIFSVIDNIATIGWNAYDRNTVSGKFGLGYIAKKRIETIILNYKIATFTESRVG